MPQPTLTPDDYNDNHELIDMDRSVDLDDVGLPGYGVAVVITPGGTERFLLVRRDVMGRDGARHWFEKDIRSIAPHEQVGKLPKPYAPTCGRRTSSGQPCKVGVRRWGDACPHHAAIESERTRA